MRQIRSPKRSIAAAALVVLAGAGAHIAPAATSAPKVTPTPAAAPRPDLRLEQTVRDTQLGETLADYAAALTSSTGVEHEVQAPFDGRPLAALNVELGLARLHRSLARLFQLTWQASAGEPPRYTFLESRTDRRVRAYARDGVQARARQRMLQRLDEVRRMTFWSRELLRQRAARGEPMARSLLHPRGAGMSRLVFQLPQEIWRQLWATGSAQVAIAALPPALQELAKQAAGTDSAQLASGEQYRIADLVVPQGKLWLQFGGTVDRPTIWARMRYGRHGVVSNILYAEAAVRHPPAERREQARASPSKVPEDARFRRKVTLRDRPRSGYFEPGERPLGARPLAEYLQQLGAQVDRPILAECAYQPKKETWLQEQWWLAADIVEKSLAEALDLLCADFEYEWQFRDGVLLLRPVRWYVPPEQQGYRFLNPH